MTLKNAIPMPFAPPFMIPFAVVMERLIPILVRLPMLELPATRVVNVSDNNFL
jgi:hypothetical protein